VTRLRLLDRRETEFKPEWLEQTIEGFLGRIMAWIERWECPSVKKLLAYEKEVSEGFAKAAWRSCADTLS
jgi:hypothetical protein